MIKYEGLGYLGKDFVVCSKAWLTDINFSFLYNVLICMNTVVQVGT
jgi:hypothetical protein